MKEDYLWNRTSSDPEIEALEKALAVFRFQANEPPAFPIKILTLQEGHSRKFFKLGFAFACVSSTIIALLLFLFQSAFYRSTDHSAKVEEQPSKSIGVPTVEFQKETANKFPAEKLFIRAAQPAKTTAKPIRIVARKPKNMTQSEKLTSEEKYAYSQLMLALSITSNELKIVKDKINGREERSAADDRQK